MVVTHPKWISNNFLSPPWFSSNKFQKSNSSFSFSQLKIKYWNSFVGILSKVGKATNIDYLNGYNEGTRAGKDNGEVIIKRVKEEEENYEKEGLTTMSEGRNFECR